MLFVVKFFSSSRMLINVFKINSKIIKSAIRISIENVIFVISLCYTTLMI